MVAHEPHDTRVSRERQRHLQVIPSCDSIQQRTEVRLVRVQILSGAYRTQRKMILPALTVERWNALNRFEVVLTIW